MAEAAIEPWVTEAGPIEAVAPAPVGTVALLAAVFAIEALGAAWGKMEPLENPPRHSTHSPGDAPKGPSAQHRSQERMGHQGMATGLWGHQQPEDPASQTGRGSRGRHRCHEGRAGTRGTP